MTKKKSMVEYDLIDHIYRQKEFSEKTFGPGDRFDAIMDHLEEELEELEENPEDLMEWIDCLSLILDGIWRQGFSAENIAYHLREKLEINENRKWPDWREMDPDKAIGHIEE